MADLFYHTGFCGPDKTQRKLKTTATMVRGCSLALRDELLSLESKGELRHNTHPHPHLLPSPYPYPSP